MAQEQASKLQRAMLEQRLRDQ